jgi:peptidyl-prolyl cis-trans isomerase D
MPAPAMDAIFKASISKLPALVGVELGEQGYAIYEIRNVIQASPEAIEKQSAQVRTQLEQLLSQQDVASYLESLKQRADIKRSLSRLGAPVQQ